MSEYFKDDKGTLLVTKNQLCDKKNRPSVSSVSSASLRTALVLEGGAMRGMYTAGVLDVFMENGISFDGIIGVSAGALFGVNFLSGQKGRVIRYNKRFNSDPRYLGILPLLTDGNIVDTDYAYRRVARELDPFDDETYKDHAADVPFYAVVTNLRTGKAEYKRIASVFEQMDTIRASGSMPFVSTPVRIGNDYYLDGAIADSIPYDRMLELGYDRLVVVLTKCDGYIKKPIPKALANACYRLKHPEFAAAVANRHVMYNAQTARLKELEVNGQAFVLRPTKDVKMSKTEKHPEKLQEMYDVGIRDAEKNLEKLHAYMHLQ